MSSSDIRQQLTVKNIFIAIVAINLLSAVSKSEFGGTFQETSKPVVKAAPQQPKAPAADPDFMGHMMPGETTAVRAERPAAPAPASPTRSKARPQPIQSDPPDIGWIMLLSIGAMALYVRYMIQKTLWNAAGQIGGVIKGAVSAISRPATTQTEPASKTEPANKIAPAKSAPAAKPSKPKRPAQPTPRAAQTSTPRKSTVVRASRWPFAA